MKFFLTCTIFFDFFNKYAKNIMKIFAWCKIILKFLTCVQKL